MPPSPLPSFKSPIVVNVSFCFGTHVECVTSNFVPFSHARVTISLSGWTTEFSRGVCGQHFCVFVAVVKSLTQLILCPYTKIHSRTRPHSDPNPHTIHQPKLRAEEPPSNDIASGQQVRIIVGQHTRLVSLSHSQKSSIHSKST